MSRYTRAIGLFTLLLCGWSSTMPVTFAQSSAPSSSSSEGNIESCRSFIDAELAHEQRLYRSVIFGQKESSELTIGSVQVDTDQDTWMKTADDEWKSLDEGNERIIRTNDEMDEVKDVPDRRGIFELRQAMSSELIPPIVQAMRAMQCRLRAVCMTINEARNPEHQGEETITIQPPGCIEFEMTMPVACNVTDIGGFDTGACDASVDLIVERESQMLELLISYDAAYRSLLQFSGMFEGFLNDFRFPLLQPLWQMVRAFGALDRLPCFLSQCND